MLQRNALLCYLLKAIWNCKASNDNPELAASRDLPHA
jgi:hypothetical protein